MIRIRNLRPLRSRLNGVRRRSTIFSRFLTKSLANINTSCGFTSRNESLAGLAGLDQGDWDKAVEFFQKALETPYINGL